jgi:hypothetical protein
MRDRVLVELLGSLAALIAMPSGLSSLAFAFDISDNKADSFSDILAPSRYSAFALSRADMIFLLQRYQRYIPPPTRYHRAHQSSASAIAKLLARLMTPPYRRRYFAHVAWNVPVPLVRCSPLQTRRSKRLNRGRMLTHQVPTVLRASRPITPEAACASHSPPCS